MIDPETAGSFWSRVAKTSTCWNWTGTTVKGYGHFRYRGIRQYAHRFVWEMLRDPIPEGMVIDHLCHNPSCCNPDHLRVVTNAVNLQNRKGARRDSASGVRGVRYDPVGRRNPWRADVKAFGRRYRKSFQTRIEAEVWATKMRAELHA